MAQLCSFTRYKVSKSEWPWTWPSRSLKVKCDDVTGLVIHGFLLICTVITCLTHRLALLAAENVFFLYLVSLGPNYEKPQMHRMTLKLHWTLKGQSYPIYVELLSTSPKFHSVLALRPLVFQIIEVFDFSMANLLFSKKQIAKNRKLKISKIPNVVL